jgi:DNA-binding MarR family transcriptional regulator
MNKNKEQGNSLDFGILTDLLGYHVRLAQVSIFRDFAANLREYDILPTQFGTLVIIGANPGIKQTDLARAIQLDRSTIVPLLDRLEKSGWVTRERLPSDRRTNALKLTPAGLEFLNQLTPLVHVHDRRIQGKLDKTERLQLVKLLNKISPGH